MSEPGVRVKICGLVRREDVLAADAAGADYVGVVLSDGFARSVDPALASGLVRGVAAVRVAVLVDEDVPTAGRLAAELGAGVIQLHGEEPPDAVRALAASGTWRVWKAVRAATLDDVVRAVERYADVADGVLVEGRNSGVVGGGGARVSLTPAEVRASVPSTLEMILAGGLTPETVRDAVEAFRPDVVDVSSGVESALGEKSAERVARFIREARSVGAEAEA